MISLKKDKKFSHWWKFLKRCLLTANRLPAEDWVQCKHWWPQPSSDGFLLIPNLIIVLFYRNRQHRTGLVYWPKREVLRLKVVPLWEVLSTHSLSHLIGMYRNCRQRKWVHQCSRSSCAKMSAKTSVRRRPKCLALNWFSIKS